MAISPKCSDWMRTTLCRSRARAIRLASTNPVAGARRYGTRQGTWARRYRPRNGKARRVLSRARHAARIHHGPRFVVPVPGRDHRHHRRTSARQHVDHARLAPSSRGGMGGFATSDVANRCRIVGRPGGSLQPPSTTATHSSTLSAASAARRYSDVVSRPYRSYPPQIPVGQSRH
jgi:hypothetical protein